MSLLLVSVVLIIISLTLQVIARNRTYEPCGIHTSQNPYPWLVGIEYTYINSPKPRILCNGALIGNRHVVSKAECFGESPYITASTVRLEMYNTIARGECIASDLENRCVERDVMRVPIERYIKYARDLPVYTSFNYHDIALVVLREEVQYTDTIRPICLPSTDITKSSTADTELYALGLYQDEYYYTNTHETAAVSANRARCQSLLFGLSLSNHTICAIDEKEVNACVYRGALLMNKKGDTYELVGLSEFTSTCRKSRTYTNFFEYLNWLRSKIPGWTHECGRRQVQHVELIMNGETSRVGDWPWHVALYKTEGFDISYICGGTLISKLMVLTAAHCVVIKGEFTLASLLRVFLGKYNLIGGDKEAYERLVESVTVHKDYAWGNYLENDIALLELQIEATYSDYVQPACWSNEAYDSHRSTAISGTVVGWGIEQTDMLAFQLKQANMPMVSDAICKKTNPLFYTEVLKNEKKFCAGWANGTSACNGDSGGGFVVFVPDASAANSPNPTGSWYVRGIVSMSVADKNYLRCDPNQYVVFTDVAKYTDWIRKHLVY